MHLWFCSSTVAGSHECSSLVGEGHVKPESKDRGVHEQQNSNTRHKKLVFFEELCESEQPHSLNASKA